MKFGRPASHIVSIVLFILLAVSFSLTIRSELSKGGTGAIRQAFFVMPYLIGLVGLLLSPARWAYYFCAVLLAAFPAFIIIADIAILFKVGGSSTATVVPSLVGCGLLLFLFYSFTFGRASRTYYGFS
jgi:hypothetical protein